MKFIDWYGIGIDLAPSAVAAHGFDPGVEISWDFALMVALEDETLNDAEFERLMQLEPDPDFRNGYAEGIRRSQVAA